MKITYIPKKFQARTRNIISHAEQIVNEYADMGYVLTLRQLYYQFVARDLLPNTHRSYKNLGNMISDARLAGMISWEAIVDRTRNIQSYETFNNISEAIKDAAETYAENLWSKIPIYLEVWVEKDALIDVVAKACGDYQVNHFSTRGYCSQTEVWKASQRFIEKIDQDHQVEIIHLSDHDPSGIDMTKDLNHRLRVVFGASVRVRRLALTMEQVEQYNPPPNPAKESDSRHAEYVSKYGENSWELDALPPNVIHDLITDKIEFVLGEDNIKTLNKECERIEQERSKIGIIADNIDSVTGFLKKMPRRKK